MDASDEAVAQSFVLQLDMIVPLNPPGGFQLVVELLDLQGGELVQLDISDARDDVLLDVVVVVVRRLLPDNLTVGRNNQAAFHAERRLVV